MIKKNAQNIQTLGFDVRDILIQQLKNRREINVNTLDNTKRWNIKSIKKSSIMRTFLLIYIIVILLLESLKWEFHIEKYVLLVFLEYHL